MFFREGTWLRDHLKCARCLSIPRWRALIRVLESRFPGWRELSIHESSPSGAASAKLARECKHCVQTHWFAGVPAGAMHEGYRCEDLERQTFPDCSFDLVVTQDVFEHVLDPAKGFAEIARTLKPRGAHVFTIPWYHRKPTSVRAVRDETGAVRHLVKPSYHGNPIDPQGSLVVTEWGADFCDFVYRSSGLVTTALRLTDHRQGIEGEFLDVFVSMKATSESPTQAQN
jgi:SAM-dependent methyltransferase